MSMQSNPSAATPESLFRLYKPRAATTGNPFTLRSQFAHSAPQRALSAGGSAAQFAPPAPVARRRGPRARQSAAAAQTRCSEPPKAGLRVLSAQRAGAGGAGGGGFTLSLNSLNVRPQGP